MLSLIRGDKGSRETIHDRTIRELSPGEQPPSADVLLKLAAAYRAAGEEQEALTLLSMLNAIHNGQAPCGAAYSNPANTSREITR